MIVIAAITSQHAGKPSQGWALPSTSAQWVAQWTAASLDNPALVCQHVFAAGLAAAFKADTGRSCRTYYGSMRSSSFRIRHVLEDGPTAEPLPECGPSASPARRTARYTVDREIVGNLGDLRDRVPAATVQLDQPLRRLFGGDVGKATSR